MMPAAEQSSLLNLDPTTGEYGAVPKSQTVRPPPLSIGLLIGPPSAMSSAVKPLSPAALVSPRRNPFQYSSRIDTYEKVKIVVLCLLGVPLLRIVLLVLILVALSVFGTLATIGYKPVDPVTKQRQPFPKWRQLIASPRPYLIRLVLFVLGYHWINVTLPEGGLDKTNQPRIVVSNHVGFIDGLFFAYYLNASIAMKAELGRIPIVGRVIQTIQPIFIDRNTAEGRKRAIHDISDHIANASYPPLLIFPEGTTSNQNYMTKFKVGSFASGLPCQPVVLKYPFKHFDLSWTPDVSALYLLLRMLCQVYNRLDVEFLPAYFPTDDETLHPESYAENVRQCMAQKLHVTCTNHAFEDVALLMRVGNYADQHVVPITDVGEVSSLTALRSAEVHKLVEYFIKRDLNGDGQISMDEMATLFPLDNPQLLERLFVLLDTDGSGSIDFRELCMGLAALNPTRDTTELISFSFRLYDLDGNGLIDKGELDRMLTFFRMFYGDQPSCSTAPSPGSQYHELPSDLEAELHVDVYGQVTFEHFSEFMLHHPTFLGHAKSKLEILRGSLRGSSSSRTEP